MAANKRPLEALAVRGFLTRPRPEEFCKLSANFSDTISSRLVIGVQIVSRDVAGLKIVPTAQIVFAIDQDTVGLEIDIPPSMIREFIPALVEMCNAADSLNSSREQAENGR